MRALAAVFSREIAERRVIYLVALVAGFVPLAGSLVVGWSRPDAAEGRILVALVAAAAFTLAFAVAFGGGLIAGETSEKRISFLFSRPVSAASIWGGKVLAVLALTLVPAALIVAPALVASTRRGVEEVLRLANVPGAVSDLLLLTLLAVLGAHAAVTVARLRSPWAGLDVLFAGAFAVALWLEGRALLRAGAIPQEHLFASTPFRLFLAAVVLALLAASYAQVAVGRTDARRAHGAFSATLWGLLGTLALALGSFAWWVASARAQDLVKIQETVLTAPRGSWTAVSGLLRGRATSGVFLYDASTGLSLRVHSGNIAFSGDGSRAAWTEERTGFFERERRADLLVADLASGRTLATGLECGPWSRIALSPSGRRLAIRDTKAIAAYDVSDAGNPKQLAVFPVPEGSREFAFVDEDAIRVFPRLFNASRRSDLAPSALEITELSLLSKKSLVAGRLDRETLPFLRMSADARLFVGTRRLKDEAPGSQALTLHDGRTGALLATLAADLRSPQARFLTGDRIVVAGIAGASARALFFEGEKGWGEPSRSVDLGPAKRVVLGGEVAPGRVAVALLSFEEHPAAAQLASKLFIVDAASGSVVSHADGLVPANRLGWWLDRVLPPAAAGTPASTLFLDADGRLVRLDPETGARTVLLGRSK